MKIDPVLQAVVLEADQGNAGVLRAALGFEVFEEGCSLNPQRDVAQSSFFSQPGLFGLFFEEDLLLAQ